MTAPNSLNAAPCYAETLTRRHALAREMPNNAMQLTDRPGTHLAASAPPTSPRKGARKVRARRAPQLIAGVSRTG